MSQSVKNTAVFNGSKILIWKQITTGAFVGDSNP